MENNIHDLLTNGALFGLFVTIISSAITLWIGFLIQAWVKGRIARKKNQDSTVLAEETILRFQTATSFRDGRIVEFGDTHTKIELDESILFIPNDEFSNSRFEIVKTGYSTMKRVPEKIRVYEPTYEASELTK